jgi:hypothetical protein
MHFDIEDATLATHPPLLSEAPPMAREPSPSDVSDDEWALVTPYLTLTTTDAPSVSTTCAL